MWHSRPISLRLPVLCLPRGVCSADSADVSSHLHASSAQYLADLGPLWEFVKSQCFAGICGAVDGRAMAIVSQVKTGFRESGQFCLRTTVGRDGKMPREEMNPGLGSAQECSEFVTGNLLRHSEEEIYESSSAGSILVQRATALATSQPELSRLCSDIKVHECARLTVSLSHFTSFVASCEQSVLRRAKR
jgi:hypothetical protein